MKKVFAIVLMIMVVFTYQNVYAEDTCTNEGTNMLPERSLKIKFVCDGTYPSVCSSVQPIVIQSMESEDVINLPALPVDDGPILRGWYADEGLTIRVDSATDGYEFSLKSSDFNKLIIKDNIEDCGTKYITTLYAKFDYYTSYTLNFDVGGAKEIETIQFCGNSVANCIEKAITLPTPTREGYKFAGWYADKDFKNVVDIKSNYASDLKKINWTEELTGHYSMKSTGTVYAKWNKVVEVEDTSAMSTKIGILIGILLISIGVEIFILVKKYD